MSLPSRLLVVVALLVAAGCTSTADSRATSAPTSTGASSTSTSTSTSSTSTSTTTTTAPVTTAAATTTSTTPPFTLAATVEPIGTLLHDRIVVDGRERTYRLYVPSTLPDGPMPLVIALHGGTGWADQFAQTNHVEGIAEGNGFLVVHPDGVPLLDGRGEVWNGGICCGIAAREQVDDVGFIAALIDRLVDQYDVDPTRIVAFGHSNGAIMSYRLACELSDRITAIGVYAGTLGISACHPSRPVSVLHLHGDADANIPIGGGVGPASIAGVDFPPPQDGFDALAAADGCGDATLTADGDLTIDQRSPCDEGTVARFVTIAGATHAWPGGTPIVAPASGTAYSDLDATAVIVEFLLSHPRP